MSMSEPLPEDMEKPLKNELRLDMVLYGNCFYEVTENGYERIDPEEGIRATA